MDGCRDEEADGSALDVTAAVVFSHPPFELIHVPGKKEREKVREKMNRRKFVLMKKKKKNESQKTRLAARRKNSGRQKGGAKKQS
jgi:hypothetical protein